MGTDSVRIAILSAIISILFTVPVCAGARKTGDPAMSYSHWEPFLVNYTCYIDKGTGSHGDPVQDGMIAGRPMWYGMEVVIYEAIPQEWVQAVHEVETVQKWLDEFLAALR